MTLMDFFRLDPLVDCSVLADVIKDLSSVDRIQSQIIDESFAHLQLQLNKPLSLKYLENLRKSHNLPSYFRTTDEISSALKAHRCSRICVGSTLLWNWKRGRDGIDRASAIWPQVLGDDVKMDIITDYVDSTSSHTLLFGECSFCGSSVSSLTLKKYPVDKLNIDLLEKRMMFLHAEWNLPMIQVAKSFDQVYNGCARCRKCVK
ncbi:hypothetical protein Clacol_004384 [Clathrus columnatus]|uniref:Uncharacterized protein n=1 Tax=Clathrus columnatus TaxID=1419009 RepID=A0AAV5A9K4_9AGAM|nr:hypothetical protein Clacol_004384 [Clathrus columnatus]